MKIERTKLPGVMIFTPDVYSDDRGYFTETLNKWQGFKPVQANQSLSKKGVIRGLHYQKDTAKLVWVAKGSIYDVAVDPETGETVEVELTAENHKQLLVPVNFAHGFQALEDETVVCYLMDKPYNQRTEGGYNPNYIDWPLEEKTISDKDTNAPELFGK
jgi:dTDP-4-dehydrorhamnose 3,5-epimerase